MITSYGDGQVVLHHGDCLDVLRELPDASVDSIVTDPPYGLGFMGKAWDELPPGLPWASECLRVLKPGGHLLAFGGTRTWHRLAVAVEDAGFEVRDSIAWLYGSGFPKSLDVSKAIDKLDAADERRQRALTFTAWMRSTGITSAQINEATGTGMGGHYLTDAAQPTVAVADLFDLLRPLLPEVPDEIEQLVAERTVESQNYAAREVVDVRTMTDTSVVRPVTLADGNAIENAPRREVALTVAHTPEAATWQGWGTALKPAFEPIVVGRKPLAGTVAANVLAHGTGALNVDGCRVGPPAASMASGGTRRSGGIMGGSAPLGGWENTASGRWPANVVLDDSQAAEMDAQSGTLTSGANPTRRGSDKFRDAYGDFAGQSECTPARGADKGGASRFFATFPQEDACGTGADGASTSPDGTPSAAPAADSPDLPTFRYMAKAPTRERVKVDGVAHPTVKPLGLMRWLVRLVTPPGGVVLEPFAGSGTTLEAVVLEGFRAIGVEREPTYLPLIAARMERVGLAGDNPPPEVEVEVAAVLAFGIPNPPVEVEGCATCGADLDLYPHGLCLGFEVDAA